jgi:hypothetical protein
MSQTAKSCFATAPPSRKTKYIEDDTIQQQRGNDPGASATQEIAIDFTQ